MAKRKKQESKKPQLPPIKCKGCGTLFIPKDRRTKFHSEECRERLYSQLYYKQTRVNKTCPNCGTSFSTTMPLKQIYCSEECRTQHQKKSKEELRQEFIATDEAFIKDRFITLKKFRSKCSFCGRSIESGIRLDVIKDSESDTGYCTICNVCSAGKDLAEEQSITNKER